jgi:Domain of unknown function (DUF4112)
MLVCPIWPSLNVSECHRCRRHNLYDVKILVVLGITVAVMAGLGIAAYFLLRRMFDRAADRVADHIGRVLAELAGRAMKGQAGRRGPVARTPPIGRLSHLGAYAASEGLSEDAARREFSESIERLARLMDAAIRLPLIGPIGLDAVLGLFPVAGDVVSGIVSVLLIAKSLKYGVPHDVIARMLGNVLFDFVLGAVPIAGDVADMWFRANLRNVAILREYLDQQAENTIEVTATRVS